VKVKIREESYKATTPRIKFEGGNKILTIVIKKEVNNNTIFVR
tara:strand:+ start:219 stop:347 length:129 start_codon:yes stop_codon:yes gene_type:complete